MLKGSLHKIPINPDSQNVAVDGNVSIDQRTDECCRFIAEAQVWAGHGLQVTAFVELHNRAVLEKLMTEPVTNAAHLLGLLYLRFGTDLPLQLEGNFAFCITDSARQREFLVTDRFGIMPVVYAVTKRDVCWAPRIKTLLSANPELSRELNPAALVDYLNLSAIPSPKTIYRAIHKLPPGHLLLSERDADITVKPYYEIDYAKKNINETTLLEEIPRKIEAAVEQCLKQADSQGRTVGAFLSGGTDSSTIVGMLQKLTGQVQAFAIGFDEPGYNELGYARLAAKHFGAQLHEYTVTPQDVLDAIDLVSDVYDEPFGNASVIPTYYCAKLARENGIDTLLAGDGGDEIFGGNERYAGDKVFDLYDKLPRLLRKGVIEPLTHALPNSLSLIAKGQKYLKRANIPLPDRFYSYCPVNALGLENIFSADFIEQLGDYDTSEWARGHFHSALANDNLDRLLHLDVKFTLTDNDLRKVSGMVERAGGQVAYPFLDYQLVDFAASLPIDLKVRGSQLRYGFKTSLERFLPSEVIRKRKHGFGLPIGVWIATQPKIAIYVRDVLLASDSKIKSFLKNGFIEDIMVRHHTTGSAYYGDILWMLVVAELWMSGNEIHIKG